MLPRYKKLQLAKYICPLHDLPAAAAAAAAAAVIERVRLFCRATCRYADVFLLVVVLLQSAPDINMPASSATILLAAEGKRLQCRATLPRQTALPVGYTCLAAVRLIAKCADMFPLVSDYPHICFLFNLLLQMLLMVLVLLSRSRSAHGHAVRLKIPVPLRTARVSSIILPSQSFS